ncbi:Uncharacterized protein M6B38_222830 [Iris pallida]|uniref:Uncharacterized protein n=1 Tax=Iris pallida TaxID=29817 RepID=A0AAX6DX37_IRIPA|nr:Uncharacterized protein M6B38_222830 [Iris pallida]
MPAALQPICVNAHSLCNEACGAYEHSLCNEACTHTRNRAADSSRMPSLLRPRQHQRMRPRQHPFMRIHQHSRMRLAHETSARAQQMRTSAMRRC